MTAGDPLPNEFVRTIALEGARPPRVRFAIEATPTECAALAKRFGLVRLDRLAATGEAVLGSAGRWQLTGSLEAAVVQTCVVSLDPFTAEIRDGFELVFAPAEDAEEKAEIDVGDADDEPLPADGRLDVGEIVAQQLSLALDPFPRKPGVHWEGAGPAESAAEPDTVRPFEGLARRLGRREET
ncbi:MAG: DUF177 domain-containing protein [Alphaproteobacteria bacterium]|nr:DUF177 domain-containing protein [Alphaproteobacteria bacterium]